MKFNEEIVVIGCEHCGNSKCVNITPSTILKSRKCSCGNMYIEADFDYFHNTIGRVLGKIK